MMTLKTIQLIKLIYKKLASGYLPKGYLKYCYP
jgi:hypothetical protein